MRIQDAINTASAGATIIVCNGTYPENIDVAKSLTIKSSSGDPGDTIVQAVTPEAPIFNVTADYVNISGFTVKGSDTGIYLYKADYCNISNNNCSSNNGLVISSGIFTVIGGNGVYLFNSSNNKIYLNNFINNTRNVYSPNSTNMWNFPSEITYTYNGSTYTNYLGNYWDDYRGADVDKNGISDTPYIIDSDKDNYPLMDKVENYIKPTTACGSLSVSDEQKDLSHVDVVPGEVIIRFQERHNCSRTEINN